jgi:hypothetical protein
MEYVGLPSALIKWLQQVDMIKNGIPRDVMLV